MGSLTRYEANAMCSNRLPSVSELEKCSPLDQALILDCWERELQDERDGIIDGTVCPSGKSSRRSLLKSNRARTARLSRLRSHFFPPLPAPTISDDELDQMAAFLAMPTKRIIRVKAPSRVAA